MALNAIADGLESVVFIYSSTLVSKPALLSRITPNLSKLGVTQISSGPTVAFVPGGQMAALDDCVKLVGQAIGVNLVLPPLLVSITGDSLRIEVQIGFGGESIDFGAGVALWGGLIYMEVSFTELAFGIGLSYLSIFTGQENDELDIFRCVSRIAPAPFRH